MRREKLKPGDLCEFRKDAYREPWTGCQHVIFRLVERWGVPRGSYRKCNWEVRCICCKAVSSLPERLLQAPKSVGVMKRKLRRRVREQNHI